MPKVTFLPMQVSVDSAAGATLMEAARSAGLPITSPCGGEGLCGKCRVMVKTGKVNTPPVFTPGPEDGGAYLACQTVPAGDVTIEIPPEVLDDEVQVLGDRSAGAGDSPAAVRSMVVSVEVELTPPTMDETTGDLERLKEVLAAKNSLPGATATLSAIRELPLVLRANGWKARLLIDLTGEHPRIIRALAPGSGPAPRGVAIDIGTTTIFVQLVDLESGRVLASEGGLNPQTSHGDDIIIRIIRAGEGDGLEMLSKAVLGRINGLIEALMASTGTERRDIVAAVAAGNSTMVHLLLRIPPESIRREPFVTPTNHPPVLRAEEAGLAILPDAPAFFVPGMSGFVGGDITAGILSCGLKKHELPCAFVDIGTNGEVVVGSRDWMMAAAASAGPAFEGGGVTCGMRAAKGAIQKVSIDASAGKVTVGTIGNAPPQGICGSGLLDAIAEAMRGGLIDRRGKLVPGAGKGLVREEDHAIVLVPANQSATGRDIILTEDDIAHAIRSKGAIFTAILLLLEKVSLSPADLDTFYVAGGFGNYLNLRNAITIGMLPDLPVEKYKFLGNTSVAGARHMLTSIDALRKSAELAQGVTYIELSNEPKFMDRYVASQFLPHTDVSLFPSVMGK